MTFFARIVKYLFWLLVVSWSVTILRRIVRHMASGDVRSKPNVEMPNNAATQKLVCDHVCGMHVAEGLALRLEQGGEVLHFCSAECRDKYLSETRKFPASA